MAASRCFCRHHAGFCRRLPFAAGQAPGCRAAGCCACHCGHRPAGELLLLVLPQRFPADQTDAPAACLLPCGAGRHRHCCVDVRPAGQARTHQPPRMGQLLLRLPHGQCGVPLRRKRESLLTERPHGSGVEVFGRHPAQRKAARLQKRLRPKNMHTQKRTADISFSSSFLL